MKIQSRSSEKFHSLSILMLGISSSLWAVSARQYFMPLVWLAVLCILVIIYDPREFSRFLKRFAQLGSALVIISLIQILFRRDGEIIVSLNGVPLIYSEGAREAILLWIRFMILFVLAKVFAQISLFHFLLFMNKIGLSLRLSLLFQTALKLIPFIFHEAQKAMWFLRFRGIDLRSLSIRDKFSAIRKLLYAILIRGVHYASYSALALETRGFGVQYKIKIRQKYPLASGDYALIVFVFLLNIYGLIRTF
ncbi:hypothetical protein GF337_10715 [candidate division KSB1 bacterium]|nr:hypothetical protein [candidate division KSB1 bacterium]